MRPIKFTIFVAFSLIGAIFSTMAGAADEPGMDEKPSFFASQSVKVTAVVEAIDHETRVVTLRRPQGDTVTFTASDEARNLDQVFVGDIVNAEYEEILSIRAGLTAFNAQSVTATVEEINLEANTFKLKGPDGTVTEYAARNPDNLRRSAVGDLVIITTSEAVAISVEVGPLE